MISAPTLFQKKSRLEEFQKRKRDFFLFKKNQYVIFKTKQYILKLKFSKKNIILLYDHG